MRTGVVGYERFRLRLSMTFDFSASSLREGRGHSGVARPRGNVANVGTNEATGRRCSEWGSATNSDQPRQHRSPQELKGEENKPRSYPGNPEKRHETRQLGSGNIVTTNIAIGQRSSPCTALLEWVLLHELNGRCEDAAQVPFRQPGFTAWLMGNVISSGVRFHPEPPPRLTFAVTDGNRRFQKTG